MVLPNHNPVRQRGTLIVQSRPALTIQKTCLYGQRYGVHLYKYEAFLLVCWGQLHIPKKNHNYSCYPMGKSLLYTDRFLFHGQLDSLLLQNSCFFV